jgi:CheY-like chemotaxis protein
MNEDRRKVMIVDGESETSMALAGMLSPQWDVTAVGNVGEAADKAEEEDFDVILTGYLLPQVSGQEGVLELRSVANKVVEEKVALLGKVRGALESITSDLRSMRPESEELLRQSQAKEEEVVGFFSDQSRRLQEEKVLTGQKILELEEAIGVAREEKEEAAKRAEAALLETKEAQKSADKALGEKAEAEARTESALKERAAAEEKAQQALAQKTQMENEEELSKLRSEVAKLGEGLQKAIDVSERAVSEKNETELKLDAALREKKGLQDKLARLQENWEKYIAAK